MGSALRHATLKVTGESSRDVRETFFGRRGVVRLTTWQLPVTLPDMALPARRVAEAVLVAPRLAFSAVVSGVVSTPASAVLSRLRWGPGAGLGQACGDA